MAGKCQLGVNEVLVEFTGDDIHAGTPTKTERRPPKVEWAVGDSLRPRRITLERRESLLCSSDTSNSMQLLLCLLRAFLGPKKGAGAPRIGPHSGPLLGSRRSANRL